jgi:hypothetical protein
MAVSYDGVNGYARTYINGVNVSEDSVVAIGADLNGIVSIAWDGTSNEFFGDWDDVHFYKAVLTDAQVLQLKNNPGVAIGGKTDPPIPTGDVEIIYYEDFEDFSITGTQAQVYASGVLETAFSSNLTNFRNLQSEGAYNNGYANNVDIISFDGGKGLKSYYNEGQCCTGSRILRRRYGHRPDGLYKIRSIHRRGGIYILESMVRIRLYYLERNEKQRSAHRFRG